MHRWIIAVALAGGVAVGTSASASTAPVPAFTVRNATHDVVYVEVEQQTPYSRTARLYVNPRRDESRYLSGPLGRFEVRVTVYSGGAKIKLPPREMDVRTGHEGRIFIDYLANGENGENLHFAVNVVSVP